MTKLEDSSEVDLLIKELVDEGVGITLNQNDLTQVTFNSVQMHSDWLEHPMTKIFLLRLTREKLRLEKLARDASILPDSSCRTEKNLVQAYTIERIVKDVSRKYRTNNT